MADSNKKKKKKQQQKHKDDKHSSDPHFKASADVKGLRFGGQFIVKSFTVRQASPPELLRLLDIPPPPPPPSGGGGGHRRLPFSSTVTYIPTNFTILAHHAWHTLTLGLGTRTSKAVVFVFESEAARAAAEAERLWPRTIALGDVNRRLIRGLVGCEMARFKFRKGCLTFYVYAVRAAASGSGSGPAGFARADDLRRILEAVVALKDFLDHTAMLALPTQQSIAFPNPVEAGAVI